MYEVGKKSKIFTNKSLAGQNNSSPQNLPSKSLHHKKALNVIKTTRQNSIFAQTDDEEELEEEYVKGTTT